MGCSPAQKPGCKKPAQAGGFNFRTSILAQGLYQIAVEFVQEIMDIKNIVRG